jgi:hypothetical protein
MQKKIIPIEERILERQNDKKAVPVLTSNSLGSHIF